MSSLFLIATKNLNAIFLEVIPVDIAINSLICIGWRVGTWTETNRFVHRSISWTNYFIKLTDFFRPKNVPVFNITCCESKKVTWRFVLDEGKQLCYKYPFEAGLWYPDGMSLLNVRNFIRTLKLFPINRRHDNI